MASFLVESGRGPFDARAQKTALLIGLYFAQGLPFGFFSLTLPVLLRSSGSSLTAISALQFLYLPWALKFLWAPYLDHRGTRRGWLLTLQISSVVAAALLALVDLNEGYAPLLVAAFLFNVIAASQDIVTDGLAVRMLDVRDRGAANGIQVGAYRLGMMLGGGVLLEVFGRTHNWSVICLCMSAVLALTIIPVLPLQDSPRPPDVTLPSAAQLAIGWWRRLMSPGMLAFALLLFCYRFGDQMISPLLGPFLTDQHLGPATIGRMKGVVGNSTSLIGAVLGGWFAFSVSRRRALLVTGVAQALTFTLYIVAAAGIGGVELLWIATAVEGVIGTMATVALFALMMDAADPEHAGTDYTLFASIVIFVGMLGNFAGARLADAFGYITSFTTATVLALAGCLALVWTLDRKPFPARIALAWSR